MTHARFAKLFRIKRAKKATATLAGGLAALALALTGCGSNAAPGPQPRTLNVLAAASLTESFNVLKARFEAQHPGVTVRLDYGGSSSLAEQINNGAPADVFASADTKNMDKVAKKGMVEGKSQTFATNHLVLAVPPGNPKHIATLADLAAPDRQVVVCAPDVPCGSAAAGVERAAGVQLHPVSEETDVKSVLHKVSVGEADAGLVYTSDVQSAHNTVQGVEFPQANAVVNTYPIAAVHGSHVPDLAADFVRLVESPEGRQILASNGFGMP